MNTINKPWADWQNKLLDSAIILAFAAACVTLGSYCYEAGFLGFFGLPAYLIELDQTVVARSFIRVGIGAVSLLAFISFSRTIDRIDFNSVRNHPVRLRLSCYVFLFCVYVIPPMIVWRSVPENAAYWLSIFLFFPFLEVVFWFLKKIGLHDEKDDFAKPRETKLLNFIGRKIVIAVALFILSLRVFNFAGQLEASFQSTFLVINEEPKLVIVRMYSTKAIAMAKNPNRNELDPTVRLLTPAELSSQKTNMYLRKLGSMIGYKYHE